MDQLAIRISKFNCGISQVLIKFFNNLENYRISGIIVLSSVYCTVKILLLLHANFSANIELLWSEFSLTKTLFLRVDDFILWGLN